MRLQVRIALKWLKKYNPLYEEIDLEKCALSLKKFQDENIISDYAAPTVDQDEDGNGKQAFTTNDQNDESD